jgi:hypothetical protein
MTAWHVGGSDTDILGTLLPGAFGWKSVQAQLLQLLAKYM